METITKELQYQQYVSYSDVDSMGVVHHSKYMVYFENARFHLVKDLLEIGKKEFLDMKIDFPVISSECNYLKSIKFQEEIIIIIQLSFAPKIPKLEFNYLIVNDKSETFAKAKTVHLLTREGSPLIGYPEKLKYKLYNCL